MMIAARRITIAAIACFVMLAMKAEVVADEERVLPSVQAVQLPDHQLLQGTWELTNENYPRLRMVIQGDKWQMQYPQEAGGTRYGGKFRLGEANGLKTVDFLVQPENGDAATRSSKFLNLYRLEGNTLRTCQDMKPNENRPAQFAANDRTIIFVFKRAAESKK